MHHAEMVKKEDVMEIPLVWLMVLLVLDRTCGQSTEEETIQ